MFLSAMRAYRDALVKRGFEVFYHAIGENDFLAPFEQKLKLVITKEQITEVNYFEIEDHFFADQLDQFRSTSTATWVQHPSPKFLCCHSQIDVL